MRLINAVVSATLVAAGATGTVSLVSARSAAADVTLSRTSAPLVQHVYRTGGQGLFLHATGPGISTPRSALLRDGTEVRISCVASSDPVGGDAAWDFISVPTTGATGYVADYFVDTNIPDANAVSDLNTLGVPTCGAASPAVPQAQPTLPARSNPAPVVIPVPPVPYNRGAAAAFADSHLKTPERFSGDDCTWYISQALWAGGLPKSDTWTDSSWELFLQAAKKRFPGATKDAVQADYLVNYLVGNGYATRTPINWADNTAGRAQRGDIIAYHWNDNENPYRVDHLAIVSSLNANGYPSVDQHSPAVNRFWSWDQGGQGQKAGWIQNLDRPKQSGVAQDPGVWLIHINGS